MIPDLSKRVLIPELMDDPAVAVHELGPALQFLERVNMLPGAADLLETGIRRIVDDAANVTLLDIGTGGGDVAVDVTRRLGRGARAIGLDRHAGTIDYARGRLANQPAVRLVRGDATALPLADGSVDVACSTTFLHHLDDAQAAACLAEMNRVARRGVVVIDLERTRLTYAGVWLVTRVANRVAAHDGPVSVRRAFTYDELRALAARAGLAAPALTRHVPFRVMLCAAK